MTCAFGSLLSSSAQAQPPSEPTQILGPSQLLQLRLLSLSLLRRSTKFAAQLFWSGAVPSRGEGRTARSLSRELSDPGSPGRTQTQQLLFFLVPNEAPCLSHTALGVPRKGDALSWTTPVRAGSQEGSSPLSSGSQPKHTSQPLPQTPVGPPQAQACRVWLQVMLDLSHITSRPNQARAEGLQHKSQPGKRSPPSQTLLYLSTGSCAPLEPHLQGPGAGGTAEGSVPRRTPALARALNPPAPLLLIATRARRITRSVFTQPNCCIM